MVPEGPRAVNPSELRKSGEIRHGHNIAAMAERVWQRHTVAGQQRLGNRFQDMSTFFAPHSHHSLLEIGCGTGAWTRLVAKLPVTVTAMDLSEDLLTVARGHIRSGRVRCIQGDAEAIPAPDCTFDYVCGVSILHHLDLTVALREVYRVVKPGGKIWFSEPNMCNPQILLQKNIPLLKRWAGDTPTETAFVRWTLRRALERVGFHAVTVAPFDFLHPRVPPGMVRWVDRLGTLLERIPFVREIAGSLLIHAQK